MASPNIWDSEIRKEEIQKVRKIGSGCYGVVWEATCRATRVAVKIPIRQRLNRLEAEAFKREMDIMRNISHPNLCLFMGAVIEVDGSFQIVTELLKGDIGGEIFSSSNTATLFQRMKWAKDAALGMAWLHGNNPCIFHRDLKPENLLIDHTGTVKVTDFGLADVVQVGEEVKQNNQKGSPIYMAPEVMKNEQLTTKVDVYSFGILLWEIITKQHAFSHHRDRDTFFNAVIHKKERPPLNSIKPPELAEFLSKCWAADYKERPTFPEIISELERLILLMFVYDPNGRKFWSTNFPGKMKAEWKHFYPKFLEFCGRRIHLQQVPQKLPENVSDEQLVRVTRDQQREFGLRSLQNLKRVVTRISHEVFTEEDVLLASLQLVLAPNPREEYISLDHYGAVLDWLGPLDGTMIDRFKKLKDKEWFHGFMSRQDSEDRLRTQKVGTYLVRFSSNHPQHFVISIKEKDKITHKLVPHNRETGAFGFNDVEYSTFQELLDASRQQLNLQHICTDSIFKTLLEAESAYN